jgi:hypothetical protein
MLFDYKEGTKGYCIVLYLFHVPSDPDTGDNRKI